MARKAKYDWGRSRDGRYQKFETRLSFNLQTTNASAQDSMYIDVAQSLSLINRKLIRQGHVFKIKNWRTYCLDADSNYVTYSVSALPRTWMLFNAYKKARSLWNQMNLEAIDALGTGNLPKYYDFKVLFDREHFKNHILHASQTSGVEEQNLLPVDGDQNAFSGTGEWEYSKWETSASSASQFYGHMLGTHADASGDAEGSSGRDLPADGGSAGLILAYQQSRGAAFTDQDLSGLDQNVDVDSPWAQLFGADSQNQEVLSDLDVDNDAPPYPADYAGGIEHPEGVIVGVGTINANDYSPARGDMVPMFEAPMGLIKIDMNLTGVSAQLTAPTWISFDTEIIGAC